MPPPPPPVYVPLEGAADRHLGRLFDVLDTDGDGVLTPAELAAGLRGGARGPADAVGFGRFARPHIHFISGSLRDPVPLFLKPQCDRTLARGCRLQPRRAAAARAGGEKDAKLAQKLGQLQQFIAVFPSECMDQLASFGPT